MVPAGGELLLQTDVQELMDAMRPVVAEAGSSAAEGEGDGGGWWVSAGETTALEHCGVASSREAYVRSELGGSIFGELFKRTDRPCSVSPQDRRLYCGASHFWVQDSDAVVDEGGRPLVRVGLTERGLDEIGNVLRCVGTPASVAVSAGAELLRVDWDAYTVTEADELYHAVWGNVDGSAVFNSPLACMPVRVNDAAFSQAVKMGAMPDPDTWLLEVALLEDGSLDGAARGGALVGKAEYEARVRRAPPGRFLETEF